MKTLQALTNKNASSQSRASLGQSSLSAPSQQRSPDNFKLIEASEKIDLHQLQVKQRNFRRGEMESFAHQKGFFESLSEFLFSTNTLKFVLTFLKALALQLAIISGLAVIFFYFS